MVAFALQKCGELALLHDALNSGDTAAITEWSAPIQAPSPFDPRAQRGGGKNGWRRSLLRTASAPAPTPRGSCQQARRQRFNLPKWPTTTIGSFPQTTEIRGLRLDFKGINLDASHYRTGIAERIGERSSGAAGRLGLDVLVHEGGRAERHGVESLRRTSGRFIFASRENGWVRIAVAMKPRSGDPGLATSAPSAGDHRRLRAYARSPDRNKAGRKGCSLDQ
ncbi:hypothetical protein [Klebsiella pneumoniae]|uniref:hypothetical protein n=1 Tax=Klebsiella pneumoniae TaxID=573 RepID=UPI00388F61D2